MKLRDYDELWANYPLGKGASVLSTYEIETRNYLLSFLEEFPCFKKYKCLAVGCGRGAMEKSMQDCFDVLLTDNSKPLIKRLKEKYGENAAEVADVLNLQFKDNSFDIIISEGLLEHFDDKDLKIVLKELSRVCKWALVLVAPNTNCQIYMKVKAYLMNNGKWIYGYEKDFSTFVPLLEQVGMKTIIESDIGGEKLSNTYALMCAKALDGTEPKKPYPYLLNIAVKQ